MIAKHTNEEQLENALARVNLRYENNITWKQQPKLEGSHYRFTLKAKESDKKGGRKSPTGRKIGNAACWHVHGDFFDSLFRTNQEAVVVAQGRDITVSSGNWEDKNIGSMNEPFMYSDACDCEPEENEFKISQAQTEQ